MSEREDLKDSITPAQDFGQKVLDTQGVTVEPMLNSEKVSVSNDWKLADVVRTNHQNSLDSFPKERKLGVTWSNLTVKVTSTDASIHENGFSQFNIPRILKESRQKPPLRTILHGSHGCVKPGEMLLVLGRPGSGCTTLLKSLANRRGGYDTVEGEVWYGSMPHNEAKGYRGQIVMNTEEELFFPTLTVGQTMDFATRLKVPFHLPKGAQSRAEHQRATRDFLLESMNISHTSDTKVGNEYVRGVSGGERKRVSIIETLATNASVFCWDNSTRGLDASTALEYTKAIRSMTDILGLSSIVTLYQAGNGIFDLFDKVLVLDGGKEIFYGTREEARPFMEDLGFWCPPGANVADFLTGVTVPTERQIRQGYEDSFPRNADELLQRYEKSHIYERMTAEYEFPSTPEAETNTKAFQESVVFEKDKRLAHSSPLTAGILAQIQACVLRQYQVIWGDKATFLIKQVSNIVQALIAGSLFYNAPDNSAGLFIKGGALFFSILYPTLVAMSEVTDSFVGRPVLAKHKSFAFFHPAAFCIAQITADIPQLLVQVSAFSVIIYWMVGLAASAGQFFTFWVIVFATAMCITACFRAIGAAFSTFDAASKASGFVIMVTVMYAGYLIAKPEMHPWFEWIFWINPLSYAFEAIMGNELHNRLLPCVGTNLVPNGPNYTDPQFQSCTGVGGAISGAVSVTGDAYLGSLSYSHSHIWRNFGIIWTWWLLFVAITIIFTSRWKSDSDKGSKALIPRENAHKLRHMLGDVESQVQEKQVVSSDSSLNEAGTPAENSSDTLVQNSSIFTWKNLSYTVKTSNGDLKLLDNVQGWVKPGMLGALMGSSGAGKTTLLDVLAQRKTDGTIHGSILVDGRPLPVSFQRSAGYCEQLDVHEPYATVREALEFSALLRQPRHVPREEKLTYVDTIINLLELGDIEDTLIGFPGAGLSIEQRKRVTIGVELVAKPSILIFLDEPTSGLDGQSAYNTVRFLRKLADVGQAVLVTIHQPSAQLFAQFDTLLLLARGGKTVYFGDIGDHAIVVKDYFARYGAPCPTEANPAEHMIDVVSGHLSQGRDWAQVWLDSEEHKNVTRELDDIVADAASKPPGTHDDGFEFAIPLWSQIKIVTHRMNVSLFRNTDYTNNKFALHISNALFNGFTFWMVGDGVGDLQLKLFTIFNFIFVAPGTIAQLQPLFIDRRDLFETREKKSKMYSWIAFVTGLVVSEFPYLIICAVLYFVCWYYTVGFPNNSNSAGGTFFVMLFYEFLYTGIGQFIAAYAPNAVFAALVDPLVVGVLVSFCGTLVPYKQIQAFWRYWMYWMDPFNYLMGSMLSFVLWDEDITCKEREFARFDTPNNVTCREYLAEYLQTTQGQLANLVNPEDTSGCRVCEYNTGADYLYTLNLKHEYVAWRDAAIVVIFVLSSYALVYALMKLRTKQSKKAQG
ncbi:hypothetical protein LTS17_006456 [Exophiala oligosperma]